jgi:hypothetical protein
MRGGGPGWRTTLRVQSLAAWPHGFRKKANQDFQFYATVEFLQEYSLK